MLLVLVFILSLAGISLAKEEGEPVEGNLIKIGTLADLKKVP